MQRAPSSHVKRASSYARPRTASSSKPSVRGIFDKFRNFNIREAIFNDSLRHLEIFMEKLAEKTIPGAAFDSFERDPPPRCHPETRLAILNRTLHFLANGESNKRLLWLVGPAGVGKSAIMQTLAETPSTPDFTLGASLFFSVDGRDDGSKAIMTLAYQLAVKSESYRNFIQGELAKDPTILDKALTLQFDKLIVEPFVTQGISPEGHKHFMILIDGLNECNGKDMQCTILELISSFCIEYPTAPLVWVIASCPESHITRFLSQPNVTPRYTKEQIEIDDNQSCEDVKCYLRNRFEKIRNNYQALGHSRWPAERDFSKLATATGGLFSFGTTVVDYIDDPVYANPASQLEEVLKVIDKVRSREGKGKRHPMGDLDVQYSRIVSKTPQGIIDHTKRLLLCLISSPSFYVESDFRFYCNWLNVPTATAYDALDHLHSVLRIPSVPDAPLKAPEFYHKSFCNYLADFERSGMFPNLEDEARELNLQCATRILGGVSKARETGLNHYDGIVLSWPPVVDECQKHKENQYYSALQFVTEDLTNRRPPYGSGALSALRLIDIQFSHHIGFDWVHFLKLASVIFGKDARPELEKLNAFQATTLGTLKMDNISDWVDIVASCCYQRQHLAATHQPRPLGIPHEASTHENPNRPDDEHYGRANNTPENSCDCTAGALQRLEDRKTHSPSDIVTTFTDVTGNYGWFHHTFSDSEHPSSTWEFIIPYQFKTTIGIIGLSDSIRLWPASLTSASSANTGDDHRSCYYSCISTAMSLASWCTGGGGVQPASSPHSAAPILPRNIRVMAVPCEREQFTPWTRTATDPRPGIIQTWIVNNSGAPHAPADDNRISTKGALTHAREVMRQAVQLDSTNQDPETVVNAYAQGLTLLSEVMERVRRGSDISRPRQKHRSVAAQEEEIRRLQAICDAYANRMNDLSTIYSISPVPYNTASHLQLPRSVPSIRIDLPTNPSPPTAEPPLIQSAPSAHDLPLSGNAQYTIGSPITRDGSILTSVMTSLH